MRIALHPQVASSAGTAAVPTSPPADWSPQGIVASRSTRGTGMAAGALDAWRGVAERSPGQGLSGVQQAIIAPFLAQQFALPASLVASDLSRVRIHVGGPAGLSGRTAVAVGLDIYVPTPQLVTDILGWDRRRWLVHELGHTMQLRSLVRDQDGQNLAPSTRRFLNKYAAGSAGAVARGTYSWLRERASGSGNTVTGMTYASWSADQPEPLGYDTRSAIGIQRRRTLSDHIHDAHRMEEQAEVVAQRFLAGTRIGDESAERLPAP